jgi:Phosphatidylinositol 3- and 4-kinase
MNDFAEKKSFLKSTLIAACASLMMILNCQTANALNQCSHLFVSTTQQNGSYAVQNKLWDLDQNNSAETFAKSESQWSHFLKTAPFLQTQSLSKAQTSRAVKVQLSSSVWGILKTSSKSAENPRYEVAAYLIDRQLAIHKTPLTVLRSEPNGSVSSLQLFLEIDHVPSNNKPNPDELLFFDYLIGNRDRHGGNYITDPNHKNIIAIDHGMAFEHQHAYFAMPDFPRDIDYFIQKYNQSRQKIGSEYYKNNAEQIIADLQRILPSQMTYEKLKQTSDAEWVEILKPYLNEGLIRNFIGRKNKALVYIEKAQTILNEINLTLNKQEGIN